MEIWKSIDNFENYEISNMGKVRRNSKILKPYKDNAGYFTVVLYNSTGKYRKKIHRLVAETFILNPDNLKCVNHKDTNKTNNEITNLEWCSYKYNNEYNGRAIEAGLKNSKKIYCIELNKTFISALDASNELKISKTSINNAANPKDLNHKTAGGYHWTYIA